MNKKILETWIHMDLDHLSECSSSLESSMEKEKKDLSKWIKKEMSKFTQEQQEEMADLYSDDYWKIAEVIPNIFRSSLFVSYYSFLENRLLTICRHLKKDNNYKLDLNDLRDTGIFRAKTYLKKVAGIKFPTNTSSWNEIISYNRIRNHIVHNEGRIPKGNSEKKSNPS